jgi:cysteine synthase B
VGQTPIVQIKRLLASDRVRIFAKLEGFNPGGSIKDRPALNMILSAERQGLLHPGKTILDATSGNTGIALAMLGAARGYPVTLALPSNASQERKKILAAFGASVELTDPMEGSDGAIVRARELAAMHPETYFYVDQYSNDSNWRAHYETTGPEILTQTGGEVTHFVTGLGTSGTMMGATRFLKECNAGIECISFIPDNPLHGIEGLKHMPTSIVPKIYDSSLAESNLEISTELAHKTCVRLAREEGLFVGVSAGAAMAAALEVARNLESGTVVTIFCDGGGKYVSDHFWEQDG